MISGAMPKWQQNFHTFAVGLMCVLMAGFGVFNGRSLLAREVWPVKSLLFSSLFFIAMAGFGVGMQVWFWRRIVTETVENVPRRPVGPRFYA